MAPSRAPRAPRAPCPICGAAVTERYAPFCSARCADRDLANWLGGAYAVPAVEDDEDGPDAADLPGDGDVQH